MDQQVTEYIQIAPEWQRTFMEEIRDILHESVPDVSESFKWSRPVFGREKDFAYLKTAKNHLTLGFYDSDQFSDPDNKLEGSGKKMRHIKLKNGDQINRKELSEWLKIAMK